MVPKCKECEYEKIMPNGKINYHGCFHPDKRIVFNDGQDQFPVTVKYQEHKTSPKWCPLRKEKGARE